MISRHFTNYKAFIVGALILFSSQGLLFSQVSSRITTQDDCLTAEKEGQFRLDIDPHEGPYVIVWPDNTKSIVSSKKSKGLSFNGLGQGRHYYSVQNSVGCFNLNFIDMVDEQCESQIYDGSRKQDNQSVANDDSDGEKLEDLALDDDVSNSLTSNSHSVYPNPFTDELQIVTSEVSEGSTLVIANSQGIILYSETINQNLSIDTSNFPSGIYAVTFIEKNKRPITNKIIKVN